jgi:DNA-binding LacI/PurR family transcriptional regulator
VVIGGEQLSHPFYFNIFQGLESEANKYGLRIIVGIKSNAEEFLQWFKPKPGEGLIIAGELTREMLMEAGKRCNDNIVVAGNCDFTGNFGSVTTNYLTALNKSMEMAVEYGCQRIGVITGPMNRLVSRDLLYSAEDCRGRHPEKIKAVVSYANIDEDGFKAMTALEKDKPDCILVTEPAFPGVWEYMLKNNLKCPEDIFIIRYGKEIQGRWYPNLAAVNLEIDSLEHGYASLQMLLENSKNTVKIDVKVVIPTPR